MVVEEIEKHPERMPEEFGVLASEVMISAWPCKRWCLRRYGTNETNTLTILRTQAELCSA
jgi:hypothetical protein